MFKMRVFAAFGAVLGLGGLVAAVPAFRGSSNDNICGVTTVYVTAPVPVKTGFIDQLATTSLQYSTIVQTMPASTEILEIDTSGLPTVNSSGSHHTSNDVHKTHTVHETHTIYETHFLTKTVTGAGATYVETIKTHFGPSTMPNLGLSTSPQEYDSEIETTKAMATNYVAAVSGSISPKVLGNTITVYNTALITVTNVHLTPGGYVTYAETAASNGLLYYVSEDSTTYWLDSQTPAPQETVVYETLTVIPLVAAPSASGSSEGTPTVSQQLTVIEGLPPATGIYTVVTLDTLSASPGYGYGGWNASVSRSPKSMVMTSNFAAQYSVNMGSSVEASLIMSTGSINSSPLQTSTSVLSLTAQSSLLASPTSNSNIQLLSMTYLSSYSSESIGASSSWLSSTGSVKLMSFVTSSPSVAPVASSSFETAPISGSIVPSLAQSISSLGSSSEVLGKTSSLLASTTSTLATPSVSPTASVTPSGCGEQGDFTLNFDDLPPLSVFDNATAQPMPIFSPYHKFFFTRGFTVVPPPTDPYLPSSSPLLVEFLFDPDISTWENSTGGVTIDPAALLGCFNFNALGASFGCDSRGPDCDWQFTGLRYNFTSGKEDLVVTQILTTSSCPGLSNCDLVPIVFDSTFQDLTTLQVNVTVGGAPKIWWMDDLKLGWYNNSCSAGLCRQQNI